MNNIGTDELMVVDAMITDQFVKQSIKLSKTVPLDSKEKFSPISDANIWIEDENNLKIEFKETTSGNYETDLPFSAELGVKYQLTIITSNGNEYQSDESMIIPTPDIDSLYAEYEKTPTPENIYAGFFNFFIDSRTNPENNKYYRWLWNSTYEITVPNPSRWLWTGGNNFIIREIGSENDQLQVQNCWKNDTISKVDIKSLLNGETEIIKHPIQRIHSDSGILKIKYSILVNQYAISPESYEFWKLIEESTNQGFLFDKQVGVIAGNIYNTKNTNEVVLGFFEVVQEKAKRRTYIRQEFSALGFHEDNQYYVECNSAPRFFGVDKIGEFMESTNGYYSLCYFVTDGPAVFFPKTCADCTLYGSNKRPDYW